MPDFFENLIIAEASIGVAQIDLSKQVLQRFISRSIISKTLMKQTIQTETTCNTGCGPTFWARNRLLQGTCPNGITGRVHRAP